MVETMKTTKEDKTKNIEEGMMNEVEAMRNKEVQAMTKRKRRGKR
jgi:hypothetical protein